MPIHAIVAVIQSHIVPGYCGYSMMRKTNQQHLILQWPFWRHDTTDIGIKLGLNWHMTHVEYANDVVHFHNFEQ